MSSEDGAANGSDLSVLMVLIGLTMFAGVLLLPVAAFTGISLGVRWAVISASGSSVVGTLVSVFILLTLVVAGVIFGIRHMEVQESS